MDIYTLEDKFHKIFRNQKTEYVSNVMTNDPFKISYLVYVGAYKAVENMRLHIKCELINGHWFVSVYFRPLYNKYQSQFMFEKIHKLDLDKFSFSQIASLISSVKSQK